MLLNIFLVLLWTTAGLAKRVYYDWNVHWTTANPDGFPKTVIGINGQYPCPNIDVNLGDTVIVNVHNGLKNESTSIHWHGMHQRGTPHMDGTTGVSQCAIPPNSSFTYEFVADQSGLYWYHAHDAGQYPDGLWGMLIVRGGEPFAGRYDKEVLVTLSDYYHEQMTTLIKTANASVQQPTPNGMLVNGLVDAKFYVEPGKTYLFRFLCASDFSGVGFFFEDHEMTVVEVDGVWTKDNLAGTDQQLRVAPGQRLSALVTMKNSTAKNYGIWNGLDINMLFLNENKLPAPDYPLNRTSYLIYNKTAPLPPQPIRHGFNFTDDIDYTPYDQQPLLGPVDHQIVFNITQENITHAEYTQQRFALNNITYLAPAVPSLYSALSLPHLASNTSIYGHTYPIYLKHNSIVEVVVNNQHSNLHPMHLHGHQFQAVARTDVNGGNYTGSHNRSSAGPWLKSPMRRDTIMLQNHGYAVIRFRADNPGVWLFHCHIEWHVSGGLMASFIEAPSALNHVKLPRQHVQVCKKGNTPWYGNSLGKVHNATMEQGYYIPEEDLGAVYPVSASEADHN